MTSTPEPSRALPLQANEPAAVRREIPGAATESRWTAPDGHALRRIDWSPAGKGRGSLLFLAGRGDIYEKYLESLDHWCRAGWQVTALDWRGQGGSGRLGIDAVTGHIDDFASWIDDLAAFWREWKGRDAGRGPHVVVGHSMGGHLALRAAAEGRIAPDAMVLLAPMLGFAGPPVPPVLFHWGVRLMAALGDRRRPAWEMGEKPGQTVSKRAALLTHDDGRYADEIYWREHRPELALGAPSWGWMERACDSMRRIARIDMLERVAMPVLVLSAVADRLVSAPAIRRAVRHMPNARLIEFGEEAAHEILREVDPVRDRALAAIDGFLADRAAR